MTTSSGLTTFSDLPGTPVLTFAASLIRTVARPSCPLCVCAGEVFYDGLKDWLYGVSGVWSIRRCAKCIIAWLDPQPLSADIPKLYSNYCTHISDESKSKIAQLQHIAAQHALARLGYTVERTKALLPQLISYFPFTKRTAALSVLDLPASESGRLLDVGCGNGHLVARMCAFGWQVSGVDPDPAAVAHCQSQGLDVRTGSITDIPEADQYDVINLSHVIEHVSDPVGLLRECGKRLKPGSGRLVIATPNLNSLGHKRFARYWRGLEVPRHFVLFSPAGLRTCATKAGLTLKFMSTETRLAQMIYLQSICAKGGEQNIAGRNRSGISTKIAARLFRIDEEFWVRAQKKDIGEEIFCVCTSPLSVDTVSASTSTPKDSLQSV